MENFGLAYKVQKRSKQNVINNQGYELLFLVTHDLNF